MQAEEVQKLKRRIDAYESAKADLHRYLKLKAVLDAMPHGDHDIASIVIDIRDPEFRYISGERRDPTSKICSLNKQDHEELFEGFLKWAKDRIDECIADAEHRINQA